MTASSTATAVPAFRLLFPPGWTRHRPTPDDERELLQAMRSKIRPYGRPDLEFQLTAAVKASFRDLRTRDGIAVYLPTEVSEQTLVPMTITAVRLTEPSGASLDGHVSDLFRQHGAEFLGDDHTIVRWRRTFARLNGLEGGINEQVNYLVPVPGSERRSAVLLCTSILQSTQEPMSPDDLDACIGLSDVIASTFAWAPGAAT
ncbi:hypothetical protein [Agromyces bauzanensis]